MTKRSDVSAPGALETVEMAQALDDAGETTLARMKALWYFGRWKELAAHDLAEIANYPDKDRHAVVVACAHAQLGDCNEARRYVRAALDWGCPPKIAARLLIAGVHNTLGRLAMLREDEKRVKHHFTEAIDLAGADDASFVAEARIVREMMDLGLLPQAADLINEKLQTNGVENYNFRAFLDVLKSEIRLLRHELSLAQQRRQLYSASPSSQSGAPDETDLKKLSVSQLGQDLWVLERTNYKRGGFFVEFGATDGVLLSNTYLLEAAFGWTGLLAEPNPGFWKDLNKNRSCALSQACIAGVTGEEVEFVFAAEFGAMTRHAIADKHGDRRLAYKADEKNVARLTTISLHDFLAEHNAPKHIDYISVDTEGSELEILEAFPFEAWDVRHWTIEHNYTPIREKIHEIMTANGYTRVQADFDDWYYR